MNHAFDPVAAVAQLRSQAEPPSDPVRLHFLEALARRTQAQQGAVKRILEDKLSQALVAYQERLTQACRPAQPAPSRPAHITLAELTHRLTHQLPKNAQANQEPEAEAQGRGHELKAVRYFRDTWSKLSVDRQLAQAIEQGPENAGPLNSHQLVLRSLSVMRDISPDYLNRFMPYVDALLWLEQAESQPVVKSTAEGESVKKRKTSGARSR